MQPISILSPHRDDAAFSLSLCLSRLSRTGIRVRVINFFTISAYGPHAACSGVRCVSSIRAKEDRKALALAGLGPAILDLDLADAPIRLNVSATAVCRPDTQSLLTADLIQAISSKIGAFTRNGLVLAPLGLGNHVDHLAVHAAAIRSAPFHHLALYEDLPYATWTSASDLADRVARTEQEMGCRLKPVVVRDSRAIWRKRRIVTRYQSQVTREEGTSIARWAAEYGGGERMWVPAASRLWRSLIGATQCLAS